MISEMARVTELPVARPPGPGGGDVCLYGWDAPTATWHGPNQLGCCAAPNRRLLKGLRAAHGPSWYGGLRCSMSDGPANRYFAFVHDLSDCAVASIYCDETKTGPAEIVAVLPASRRSRLRAEFAFEFLAFTRFLGSVTSGAELEVHDAIAAAIANCAPSTTLVFSISSGLLPAELDPVISCCVEEVAVTLHQWLEGPLSAA
jgi:hypothetical protein